MIFKYFRIHKDTHKKRNSLNIQRRISKNEHYFHLQLFLTHNFDNYQVLWFCGHCVVDLSCHRLTATRRLLQNGAKFKTEISVNQKKPKCSLGNKIGLEQKQMGSIEGGSLKNWGAICSKFSIRIVFFVCNIRALQNFVTFSIFRAFLMELVAKVEGH